MSRPEAGHWRLWSNVSIGGNVLMPQNTGRTWLLNISRASVMFCANETTDVPDISPVRPRLSLGCSTWTFFSVICGQKRSVWNVRGQYRSVPPGGVSTVTIRIKFYLRRDTPKICCLHGVMAIVLNSGYSRNQCSLRYHKSNQIFSAETRNKWNDN